MNLNQLVLRSARRVLNSRAHFSQVTRSQGRAPASRDNLQFSKRRLTDFGELPHGEIPYALQFSRPSSLNRLSNGVTVVTENWAGKEAAVTVAVKAGSRQEQIANSSVSQFVSRLTVQGTTSKSKSEFELAIDKLGAQLETKVTREMTYFTIFCHKDYMVEAVSLLGDAIANPAFDATQIEAEKIVVHQNASRMDPEQNTYENIHYTSFRDHAMGQPTHGIRDNVYSITPEQIRDYHNKYYVGENIVVSGAGDFDCGQFSEAVDKHFGNIQAKVQGVVDNSEQPFFTPSLMFQRDDELPNTSAGAAFIVPGWNHPDFFAINYFKSIIGEFRVDKHTGGNLNAAHLQYNSFHEDLGNYADIVMQKPFYFAYSDCGLFGSFLFGNEIWNRQMLLFSQNKMSCYAQTINQVEVFRARNKYWNNLLTRDDPVDVSIRNSNQASYLGRLVSRTELATRISYMDPNYIQNTASKWFWDVETSVVAWGPLHNIIIDGHYDRQYKRATLGEYSVVRVKTDF